MRKIILILFLLLSGCSDNGGEKFGDTVDFLLKRDPGWNASGYVIKNQTSDTKLGLIDNEILHDMSRKEPKNLFVEEDTKDQGFIFGFRIKKDF